MAIVIVGALNWGLISIDPEYNILNVISRNESLPKRCIMGLIGLSAIYISLQQTSYLPFLGECAVPVFNFLDDTTVDNLSPSGIERGYRRIQIPIPKNESGTKIIYWAANPNDSTVNSPMVAYGNYENSGVANINNGIATISLLCPANYKVGFQTLPKHIHFRVVNSNGILSRVYTHKKEIMDICEN
jgi:uncharacterized membrane protein YuzA (DUF378 family)